MNLFIVILIVLSFIVKDVSSQKPWASKINSGISHAESVAIDNTGCVAVTGPYKDYLTTIDKKVNITGNGIFAIKYDPNGNFLWKVLVKTSFSTSIYTTADFDTEDNLIIAASLNGNRQIEIISSTGYSNSTMYGRDFNYIVAKFDSKGNFMWISQVATDPYYMYNHMTISKSNNNILLGGHFTRTIGYVFDSSGKEFQISKGSTNFIGYIINLSSTGKYLWFTTISNGKIRTSSIDTLGNYYIMGTIDQYPISFRSFSNGTLKVSKTVATTIAPSNYLSFIAKYTYGENQLNYEWVSLSYLEDFIPESLGVAMGNNLDIYALTGSCPINVYDSNLVLKYIGGCQVCTNIVKYNTNGLFIWGVSIEGGISNWINSWRISFQSNTVVIGGPLYVDGPWIIANQVSLPEAWDASLIAGLSENGTYRFHYQLVDGSHAIYGLTTFGKTVAMSGGYYDEMSLKVYDSSQKRILTLEKSANPQGVHFAMAFDIPYLNVAESANLTLRENRSSFETIYRTDAKFIVSQKSQMQIVTSVSSQFLVLQGSSFYSSSNNQFTSKTRTSENFLQTISSTIEIDESISVATSTRMVSTNITYIGDKSDTPIVNQEGSSEVSLTISIIVLFAGFAAFVFGASLLAFCIRKKRRRSDTFISDSTFMSQSITDIENSHTTLTVKSAMTSASDKTLKGETGLAIPAYALYQFGLDFRVAKVLAKGGYGVIHIAQSQHPVLLKHAKQIICKEFKITTDRQQKSFYQELAICFLLKDHPNVVMPLGYTERPFCIIFKYYQLGNLLQFIKNKDKRYTKRMILQFSHDISTAIGFMFSKGIVHCDLKTDNILLDRGANGRIYCVMTDFGIAKVVNNTSLNVASFQTVKINAASVAYASPEFLRAMKPGQSRDYNYFRSDIYSYSCILYEMICQLEIW